MNRATSQPVRIEELQRSHISAVSACAHLVWHATYDDLLPAGQVDYMLADRCSEQSLQRYLESSQRWFEVALDSADDVIGYASWRVDSPTSLWLEQLYVVPSRWGTGVADVLLQRVLDHAASAGCTRVALQANRNNTRAHRFYQRRGFTAVGRSVVDIGGGFVMDDDVYARDLAPSGAES